MALDLGQLLLKIGVSEEEYYAQLERIRQRTAQVGDRIESEIAKISISVDDSELDGLNRHLDKKVAHHKRVQQAFDRNPLKVKVDGRSLTELNKKLDRLEKGVSIPVSVDNSGLKEANRSAVGKEGSDRIVNAIKNLESTVQAQGTKSVGDRVGEAVAAPVRAVGSVVSGTVGQVATGALEKFGRDAIAPLSSGLSSGLQQELSYTIGSFDYLGEQIGRDVIKGIIYQLGREGEQVEEAIAQILGPQNVAREGAAVRGRAANVRAAASKDARSQAEREYNFVRQNLDPIKEQGEQAQENRQRLISNAQRVQQQVDEYFEKLGGAEIEDRIKEIQQSIEALSERAGNEQSPNAANALMNQAKALSARRSSLMQRLDELRKAAEKRFDRELGIIENIDLQILAKERELGRYGSAVDNALALGIKPNGAQSAPRRQTSVPSTFEAIAQQVAGASNVSITSAQIPNLVASSNISDKLKDAAQYKPGSNTVEVSQQMLDAIKSNQLSAEQIETVVHELRHAVQLGFGTRKINQGAEIDLLRPNREESRRLGRRIELSTGDRSTQNVRRLEQDAYVFADRYAKQIAESIKRAAASDKFLRDVGVGGGRLENRAINARNTAARYVNAQRRQGVGGEEEYKQAIAAIESVYENFSAEIDSLVNVDLLPTDQIEAAGQELNRKLKQSMEALKKLAVDYGKVAVDIKPERELEPVINQVQNQARAKAEQSRAGSRTDAAQQRTRINRQVYAPLPDVWDDVEKEQQAIAQKVTASQEDIEQALSEAQQLADKFKGLYQLFKGFAKEGDLSKVEGLNSDIARYAADAQAAIDRAIARAKTLDLPDNSLVNQLGGQKGNIGRKVSLAQQQTDKLRRQSDAANSQIDSAEDESLASVRDIAENLNSYLRRLNNAIDRNLDPEEVAANVGVRQAQRDLNIDKAEEQVNRRVQNSQDAIARSLSRNDAGSFGDLGEDSLGDRINRIFKAEMQLNPAIAQVQKLTGGISGLARAFAGFTALTVGLSVFRAIANDAVEVAAAFQQVENRLKFVTGSSQAAAAAIEEVRDRSNALGTNFQADIEGFSQLSAAGRGTSLEGDAIDSLAESFQQASSIYQLNTEQQSRAYTALEQIISKGKLSAEEIRGQLSEALPGSFQIAARAMGVTTAELDRMLQAGEVLSTDFLPKFARQLQAENYTGLADSADSYTASVNRLQNQLTEVQQSVGEKLIPVKQLGLDVLAELLEVVADNMEIVMAAAGLLSAALSAQLVKSLIAAIAQLKLVPIALSLAKGGIAGLMATMGPMLPVLAAIAAAGVGVGVAMQSMGKSSGEAGKLAGQASAGFEDLMNRLNGVEGAANKANRALKAEGLIGKLFNPNSKAYEDGDIQLPGTGDRNPINRILNFNLAKPLSRVDRFVNNRQVDKQERDRIEAASQLSNRSQERISAINQILSGSGKGARELAEYNRLEEQLKKVRIEQQAVRAISPENIKLLQELKDRESELIEQQGKVAPIVNLSTSELQKELNLQTAALESYENDFNNDAIGFDAFEESAAPVRRNIDALTNAQERFNTAIDDGARSYEQLARRTQDIQALTSDRALQINQQEAIARTQLLQQPGLNAAQREAGLSSISEASISARLQSNQQAIAALRAELQSKEISGSLSALGIDGSSNIGPAQLSLIKERSGDSVELTSAIELLEAITQLEQEAAQLGQEGAQVANDIAQQMTESDRALTEYFREIENQVSQLQIESDRAQNNLGMAKVRRDINKAVNGVTGSFLDGFGDLLVEMIEAFNEPLDAALDRTSGLLSAQMDRLNALNQNTDMQRQLAGGYGQFAVGVGGAFVDAVKGTELVGVAKSWVGREFNEGVREQCAYFVREAFAQAGIDLGVTADTMSSGDPGAGQYGAGAATSLIGSDIGNVYRTSDPNAIPAGAIIGFANTYGNFEQGAITHVGIASGNGQMVDRSTSARPVTERAITTFPADHNGEYVYVIPRQIAAQQDMMPRSPNQSMPVISDSAAANLSKFFDAISYLEANNDSTNYNKDRDGNIYASGAFQFTPITRRDAAELGLADPGDRSLSYQEQKARAIAYARVRDPEAIAAAESGDFRTAERLLRNRWTSLPGAAESHQSSDRYDQYYAILGGQGGTSSGSGGLYMPGVSADNSQRLALDNARMAQYGAGLNLSRDQIEQMYGMNTANIEADYQARLIQAEINQENALQKIVSLTGEARKQMEEAYRQSSRAYQDLIVEGLPDTIDNQTQQEIREVFRRREDDELRILSELEKYQNTMTEARSNADAIRGRMASEGVSEQELASLQTSLDELGITYMTAQDAFIAARDQMAELDHTYDDILDKLTETQNREAQERAFQFRERSEALEAEFAREVQVRDLNRDGQGFDAIALEGDLKIKAIELDYDSQVRAIEELRRTGEYTDEQADSLLETLEAIARVQMEGVSKEVDQLSKEFDRIPKDKLFELEGLILDAQTAGASNYGIGAGGLPKGAAENRAIATQQRSYERELEEFRQLAEDAGVAAERIAAVEAAMYQLNELSLENIRTQFNDWTPAISTVRDATESLFSSLFDRTKTVGEAFIGFFDNILSGFAAIASKQLTDQIFGGIFGTNQGVQTPGIAGGGNSTASVAGSVISAVIGAFNDGGTIPDTARSQDNYRTGYGEISDALRREGPNSVLAALTPGEMVLTQREAQTYNEYKRVYNFAQGGVVPGAQQPSTAKTMLQFAINFGGVNTTVNGGVSPVDANGLERAIATAASTAAQNEIRRQQGLGGSLEPER